VRFGFVTVLMMRQFADMMLFAGSDPNKGRGCKKSADSRKKESHSERILKADLRPAQLKSSGNYRGVVRFRRLWSPAYCGGNDVARKCATTSISAVCGNMSSGVTDSMVKVPRNSARSRASVGGLQET
jgi:hypothetical protein